MEKRLRFNKFKGHLAALLAAKGAQAVILFRHGVGNLKMEVQLADRTKIETELIFKVIEPFLGERGFYFDEESPHRRSLCRDYYNKKERRLMSVLISNHSGCDQMLIQITCTIYENIDLDDS